MTARPEPPPCCKHNGLFFADRQRRCPRHQSREDKALVAELERKAKPIIRRYGGWPYGPNIDVESRRGLVEWAEYRGLELAKSSLSCPHWLRGQRCGERPHHDGGRAGWQDHVTCWTYGGAPAVILAHPYNLWTDSIAELGDLAAQDDLEVRIRGGHWYGWGTVGVEVWLSAVLKQMEESAHRRERATSGGGTRRTE